uniref:ARAD1D09526p n=1 Tax=Blastobotrys adeninivorans TaxID=409370 RepID=A0A060T979_BLAAD
MDYFVHPALTDRWVSGPDGIPVQVGFRDEDVNCVVVCYNDQRVELPSRGSMKTVDCQATYYIFEGTVAIPRNTEINVEIKCKVAGQIRHLGGTQAYNRSQQLELHNLNDIFEAFNPDIEYQKLGNRFIVSAPAPSSPVLSTIRLGIPKQFDRYLCIYRAMPSWFKSDVGIGVPTIEQNGQLLVYERLDGQCISILTESGGEDCCTTYLGSEGGRQLLLHVQNDSPSTQSQGFRAVIGIGSSCQEAIDAAFNSVPKNRGHKANWSDGIFYCTWNSLGDQLSHEKIVNAISDLDSMGVRISTIIIDDGWQKTNSHRQLQGFEPNIDRFPRGLQGLVREIRLKFPYVVDIGVWSTVAGYWNGLDPHSKLAKSYSNVICNIQGTTVSIPDERSIYRFYKDYFKLLASWGVTCIKMDNQATVDMITDPMIRGRLWQPYQDALKQATEEYLQGKIIYSMSMVPNIIHHSLIHHPMRGPTIVRNSDDFFPDVPDSHHFHVFVNFFNSIYTRHLSALPDYDMFQTVIEGDLKDSNGYSFLHAAARCLSGGPITITDIPSCHNKSILHAISLPVSSKADTILRPSTTPLPWDIFYRFRSRKFLRIVSHCEDSILVGLFNFSDIGLSEPVGGEQRIWKSFRAHEHWTGTRVLPLEAGKCDVLIGANYHSIGSSLIACLGAVGKLNAPAIVHKVERSSDRISWHLKYPAKVEFAVKAEEYINVITISGQDFITYPDNF